MQDVSSNHLLFFFSGAYSVFPRQKRVFLYFEQAPHPLHAYLSRSTQAFLFLLSYPTGRSEENNPTLQPLVRAFDCFQPHYSPLCQPWGWKIADGNGIQWLLSKYSNIDKFRRLLQAIEPTLEPTKKEWICAFSCRHEVQGRTKIKTAGLHMPCPEDIQTPVSYSRPSSGFVEFQEAGGIHIGRGIFTNRKVKEQAV